MSERKERSLISRKMKVIMYLVCVIVLLAAGYLMLGAPSLSVTMAYRKELASHGMEEVRIVGTVNIEDATGDYDEILVAETMDKVILFCHQKNWNGWLEDNMLIQRERTGDIMILTPPGFATIDWESEAKNAEVPMVLYGAPKEAVRAEFEVEISKTVPIPYTAWTEEVKGIVRGEAEREDGIFLFWFRRGEGNEEDDFVMDLASISTGNSASSYPAVVRFYDEEGGLIREAALELKTPALEAHEQG